jgi:RNA polymerase sigma-70 factor (ECF subfamily)
MEARLVARARGGDREAFDGLVGIYAPQVYNLSLRITGSPEEAEDCVQETFLRAFAAIRSFRGQAAFFTWLYRVALNVARDAARRRVRSPLSASELVPRDDQNGLPDPTETAVADSRFALPEEVMFAERRRQIVLQAVAALPPHHREVIVLYDLQGLSYEQIARITGARVGTVKSRLNRARLALKECLAPHLELLRG